jgi:phosphonate transport system substrate-binding protein
VDSAGPPLRFLTLLAPSMAPVYRAAAEAVAAQVGRVATFADAARPDAFERGDADVAFMCSPPYLWLADRERPLVEAIAAPILTDPACGGRPVYLSDVIVRGDAPPASFAELRGASFAYNEPWSWSGYGVVQHRLVRLGQTHGFFERVVETGFHQRSIRLVAGGEVDAAAIDRQVLSIALRDHPGLAERIRVIDTLGPSPIQPVVAATALARSLREELRGAFGSLGAEAGMRESLERGLMAGFATAVDSDYDPVREMLREIRDAGLDGFEATAPPSRGTHAT